MIHEVIVIEDINDKQSIINAICEIQDDDMNGTNGDEYLWKSSKDIGCKTNLEYLRFILEKCTDQKSVNGLLNCYMANWINHDGYYTHYTTCGKTFNNNKGVALSVTLYDTDDKVSNLGYDEERNKVLC